MERQTLQQQTPVFHVCQQCNGSGCAFCSDLCIVEGDLSPINRVIGVIDVVHCLHCTFIGAVNEFDVRTYTCVSNDYDPDIDVLVCPVCDSEQR